MNIKDRALELKKIKNRIDELQPMYEEYFQLLENQRKKLQELAGLVGNHTGDGRAPDRLLEMIVSLVDEPIKPAEPIGILRRPILAPAPVTLDTSIPMVMVTRDLPGGDSEKLMELSDDEDFESFKCLIAEERAAGTFRIVFVYMNEDGEFCKHTMDSEQLPQGVEWWTVPMWLTNLLVSAL